MINQILELSNKVSELEEQIQKLTNFQSDLTDSTNHITFERDFSSLEVILKKRVFIGKFEATKGKSLLFQTLVDIDAMTAESVRFSVIVNDIAISKNTKSVNIGSNQLTFIQSYTPIASESLSVYIEITPLSQKQLSLSYVTMLVFGTFAEERGYEYLVTERQSDYLISALYGDSIFYLTSSKAKNSFSFLDFNFYDNAISHSIVYSSTDAKTYIFKVDTNGNLFYSDFTEKNEKFIDSGVSKVSASISQGGEILVAYIKNNECFYFEITTSGNISLIKKLSIIRFAKSCLCYYNSFRQKFCIVISDKNDSNFFVEQSLEVDEKIDNISASYCIDIVLN